MEQTGKLAARKRHIANIHNRYMAKKKSSIVPDCKCAKCGVQSWYPDDTEGGWYCPTCGARGHFESDGRFVQY